MQSGLAIRYSTILQYKLAIVHISVLIDFPYAKHLGFARRKGLTKRNIYVLTNFCLIVSSDYIVGIRNKRLRNCIKTRNSKHFCADWFSMHKILGMCKKERINTKEWLCTDQLLLYFKFLLYFALFFHFVIYVYFSFSLSFKRTLYIYIIL